MTGIYLEKFSGIAPRFSAKKLATDMAVVCNNMDMSSESLQPLDDINYIKAATPTSVSLFEYPDHSGDYLESAFRRQYVRSVIPDDVLERIFYTDTTKPKIRSGASEFDLGIERPDAPIVSVIDYGDVSDVSFLEYMSYQCTYVDQWEAEGPSSLASDPVEVGPGFVIRVTLPGTPSGNGNWASGAKTRLYRSATGSTGSVFQYVREEIISTGIMSPDDTRLTTDLEEAIQSDEWIGPPNDNATDYPDGPLASLVAMPGGFLAGHSGKSVYFSEPYLPHAWPLKYRVTQDADIVGVVPVSGGLFVCTTGRPYLLAGSHPVAMTAMNIDASQPCIGRETIVDMGKYAIYASPDGLVRAQGNVAELVTEDYITPKLWKDTYASHIVFCMGYEETYLAVLDDDTILVFDMSAGKKGFQTISGLDIRAAYWDTENDDLIVHYMDTTDKIGTFNEGSPLLFTWKSKENMLPVPVSMSCGRVQADAYPVYLSIWADGVAKVASFEVPSDQPFRLPNGFIGRTWQIQVQSFGKVDTFGIWDSMAEVQ